MEDLTRFLAMEVQGDHAGVAGSFISIMNLINSFKGEIRALVERMIELEKSRAETLRSGAACHPLDGSAANDSAADAPITVEQLASVDITPCPVEDPKRMNSLLKEAKWEKRQREPHNTLVLAFGVLGRKKEELVNVVETPDMIDPMRALAEDCRSSADWLKAAAGFLESAEPRIMVGFAAPEYPDKIAA